MRVPALEFDSVRAFALSETYGDPSWGVVVKFRLVAPATSDQYLSEMLAAIPALRTDYLGHAEDSLGIAASHGPYRPGILTGANYAPCTVEEAEDKFGSWIRGLSEPDSIDTEPILSREIRPLLAQAELFAQSGVYNEWEQRNADPKVRYKQIGQVAEDAHSQLGPNAMILDGWIEVVAINRASETLMMIIAAAD